MYKKFCDLNLNLSAVGLVPGDTKGNYFCTPKGAKVIGWAGVDGIHYCFIRGFGDMVFAVEPMSTPGNYVHPIARSFEEFLRLLLACGDLAAVQQAYAWDEVAFDVFLSDNPVTKEQRILLDFVAEKLSLTPMESPFAEIKTLQARFDYDSIPFKKEYYDGIPVAQDVSEQRKPKEWKVYFDAGFYGRRRTGRAGTELLLEKSFSWNGNDWYIPAGYVCGKGLVVDVCIKVEPEVISAYYEKWGFAEGRPDRFTEEDREQAMRENPMDIDFQMKAVVNGKVQENWSGSGMNWIPECCFFGEMENTEEAIEIVERYGLDRTKGWVFHRMSLPWATKTKPVLRTLALVLEPCLLSIPGPKFKMSQIGESVSFLHPVTGETHTFTVQSYRKDTLTKEHFPADEYEFPLNFTQMTYTLSPDIPDNGMRVKDVCRNDAPRRKAATDGFAASSIGIIGGGDGPTSVFLLTRGTVEKTHIACSALRFEPAETVEWQMEFHIKPCEEIRVELLDGVS